MKFRVKVHEKKFAQNQITLKYNNIDTHVAVSFTLLYLKNQKKLRLDFVALKADSNKISILKF